MIKRWKDPMEIHMCKYDLTMELLLSQWS